MLTLAAARELLSAEARPLPTVTVSLENAVGCRLVEAPCADIDLPPADVSVMDGYAVRATDVAAGCRLPVVAEVRAEQPPALLPPGTAARIFTGATIPAGADAVIPQEQATRRSDGTVELAPVEPGAFVRRQGELCRVGAVLASPGDEVTPQLVALLAAAGASQIQVVPRARVAVLSTGSELVPIDKRPAPGQIRDSNGAMLAALAQRARFPVTLVSHAPDEPDALRAALEHALSTADLVLTSGGVSVGDHDLVPQTLECAGAQLLFHRVSIKPGKPILAARRGPAWVLGLPGNPVSALVGWRLFGRQLGQALSGVPGALNEQPETGTLAQPAINDGTRMIFAPAQLQPGLPLPAVHILTWRGSHDVVAVARASILAQLDAEIRLSPENRVPFYRLD
jgi:molybdopterin molybdotransferase